MWSGGLICFGLVNVADRLRSFGQGDEERVVDVLIVCVFSFCQHLKNKQSCKVLSTLTINSTQSIYTYFSLVEYFV